MLIILSGCETINKKFLSRKIISTLNQFKVDQYKIDFTKNPFEVYNDANELMYKTHGGEVLSTKDMSENIVATVGSEPGVDTLASEETVQIIDTLYDTIFNKTVAENHFRNNFLDLLFDHGVTTEVQFHIGTPNLLVHYPSDYKDVLNNYNNRKFENFVVTGSFSKGFIDQARKDLGEENVLALNIIRHPSVCFLIHEKNAEHYSAYPDFSVEQDLKKLELSIVNAANLKRFADVVTIKFEDIIQAGKFTVNSAEIDLPAGYDSHNGLLTQWENNNVIPMGINTAEDVDQFNETFTHFDSTRPEPFPMMPDNIFEALGYTPLSYDEIVKSAG